MMKTSAIEKIIEEKINPILDKHLGGAVLSSFEDGIAYIRLTGQCAGCMSAQATIDDIIKKEIIAAMPSIKDVVLDTSVSDELLGFAREILAGKR